MIFSPLQFMILPASYTSPIFFTRLSAASRDPFEDYAADSFSFGNRFMSQYGGHDNGDQHIESMNGGTPAKFPHNPATIDLASKLRRQPVAMPPTRVMTKLILIMVWRKLLRNPNTYSSILGLTWSLISSR
jgi:auxin efflux carrier family